MMIKRLLKKKRNLKAYEIVLQILKIEEITKQRVSHVVVMGIGEPFDNYQNTMRFIEIINSPFGLEIGARHITVSTSGIVERIKQFADDAGKKGGEFYTPRGVVQLIVQLIKPQPKQTIYDPTMGSGGMLIESARYIAEQPNGKVGNNINVSLSAINNLIMCCAILK